MYNKYIYLIFIFHFYWEKLYLFCRWQSLGSKIHSPALGKKNWPYAHYCCYKLKTEIGRESRGIFCSPDKYVSFHPTLNVGMMANATPTPYHQAVVKKIVLTLGLMSLSLWSNNRITCFWTYYMKDKSHFLRFSFSVTNNWNKILDKSYFSVLCHLGSSRNIFFVFILRKYYSFLSWKVINNLLKTYLKPDILHMLFPSILLVWIKRTIRRIMKVIKWKEKGEKREKLTKKKRYIYSEEKMINWNKYFFKTVERDWCEIVKRT